jgi:hypothetical protein
MNGILTQPNPSQSAIVIPKTARPIAVFGYESLGAAVYGTPVEILQYTVKANYFALFQAVVFDCIGGTAPGPGDVTYAIDVDRPVGATTGYTERDYGAVPFSLGAFQNGPVWAVEFKHWNQEVIRIKGTPVANVLTSPGTLVACLLGWEWLK